LLVDLRLVDLRIDADHSPYHNGRYRDHDGEQQERHNVAADDRKTRSQHLADAELRRVRGARALIGHGTPLSLRPVASGGAAKPRRL
jgi:hypothetical protein